MFGTSWHQKDREGEFSLKRRENYFP